MGNFANAMNMEKKYGIPHSLTLCLAIVFSWILWCIANFSNYAQLGRDALARELLLDFAQHLVEITLLLELSLLYIKLIVKAFWNTKKTTVMLLVQVMVLTVLNGISSIGVGYLYLWLVPGSEAVFDKIVFTDFVDLSVLSTAYLVIFLVNRYRDEEIVLLQAKLRNLSLQTNNHFIFNSFSTLSGLIHDSPAEAEEFLQGLSKIYRYLVVNGEKNVVDIKDEMSFARDYAGLVSKRYSGISIEIDPRLFSCSGFVCPVSIQGLIENAVKHNRHGTGNSLRISVRLSDNYILVSNNVLPREDDIPDTGIGLVSLVERYRIFTEKPVQIKGNKQEFEVSVPILKSDSRL